VLDENVQIFNNLFQGYSNEEMNQICKALLKELNKYENTERQEESHS